MAEKRMVPRFKVPLRVEYNNASFNNARLEGYCQDLNLKGIRLVTDDKIGLEQLLNIYFHFPDNSSGQLTDYQATGKVVWERMLDQGYQTGIYFISIKDTVRKYMLNYIFDYFTQELKSPALEN